MKIKNPLSELFGAFLRSERKNSVQTSKEIAIRLGLGESTYRLIESGAASMNTSRIVLLIKIFSQTGLKFGQVSKFLIGVQLVEHFMSSNNNNAKQAFEELVFIDPDFKKLYRHVLSFIFSYEKSDRKENLLTKGSDEVKNFLSNIQYAKNSDNSFWNKTLERLNELPTLNLGLLESFTDMVSGYSLMHSIEWEKRNRNKIISITALCETPDFLLTAENFQHARYRHLFLTSFKELKLVFIETKESEADLKNDFLRLLSVANPKRRISQEVKDKINIQKLPYSKEHQADDCLTLIDSGDIKKYQALWSYNMMNGDKIAFMGSKLEEFEHYINLKLRETLNKNMLLDDLLHS